MLGVADGVGGGGGAVTGDWVTACVSGTSR